jgi:hypothetical protein
MGIVAADLIAEEIAEWKRLKYKLALADNAGGARRT